MKETKCEKCGKLFIKKKYGKVNLCKECNDERIYRRYLNNIAERAEIVSKNRKKVKRYCVLCGKEITNRYYSAKYCTACSTASFIVKNREYAKRHSRKRNEEWKNLSEQEQLRRMELVSQKKLYLEEKT